MNWEKEAKILFLSEKPEHFTDYTHCEECFDHDQTLIGCDVNSIGYSELGNPAWDPLCFVTVEGFKYYFSALVRLSLSDIPEEYYISQLLFHLQYDGKNNKYIKSFNAEQRRFVHNFLVYLMENRLDDIRENMDENDLLNTMEIWNPSNSNLK